MTARIITGDVFDTLPTLAPGSVDIAVTSPPYWMLRSYLPKDHPMKSRELGSEPTPADYIRNMVEVFRLVRTALADHGTLWLNVGDTYAASGRGGGGGSINDADVGTKVMAENSRRKAQLGYQEGDACLIPQRLAIALQEDGWIVRSMVVWHKPSCMPLSLAGWRWRQCRRVTKSKVVTQARHGQFSDHSGNHRYNTTEWEICPGCKKCKPNGGLVLTRGSWRPTPSWEPVWFLAKSADYYADGEAVKQPPSEATIERDQYTRVLDDPDEQFAVRHDHETVCDGANLRDVWTIASEPLKEKHYAAYPTELVSRCLRAGTSAKGYCSACGAPWARVIEPVDTGRTQKKGDNWGTGPGAHGRFRPDGRTQGETDQPVMGTKTIDWRPSCKCKGSVPRPGVVLDPFAGSGRTGVEATRLGLDFVGCELNPEYADMARRIIRDEAPLFAG